MLYLTGINHKKAPISIREKLVFSNEEVSSFLGLLTDTGINRNCVLLSTCNRTEIYYTMDESCAGHKKNTIIDLVIKYKHLDDTVFDYFYFYSGKNAIEHLFRVSGGLDSLVLGENQILGQVKNAYHLSVAMKCTNTILNKLFHKAFEIGKKIRDKTDINRGASSVGYAAVELALKIFNSLQGHSALLVGVGETGMHVLKSIVDRGCSDIYIVNRTFEKALKAAKDYNGQPVPFEQLIVYMGKVDIIITATSSPTSLVTSDDIQKIMHKRKNRYLFIIDLSVPRDVEESVGQLENVFLYNIDSLQAVVRHNYTKRKKEIKKAEGLIEKAVEEILMWSASLHLSPTIRGLKECVETIGKNKLKLIKNHVTPREYECLKEFNESINKKLCSLIIKNLKEYSHNGQKHEFINMVNKLFGI